MRQAMRKTGQDLGRDYPLRAQIKDLSGLFASAERLVLKVFQVKDGVK